MLWHRVFTQLVAVTEKFKIFSVVMVLEGLSNSSKKGMSTHYWELFQSISLIHNLISFQIQFNVITPLILVAQVDCVHQVFHHESYAHNSLPYVYYIYRQVSWLKWYHTRLVFGKLSSNFSWGTILTEGFHGFCQSH